MVGRNWFLGVCVAAVSFAGCAYQDFAVRFTGPGASRSLEFRTYWTDGAYIRQDRVTVRRVP